jgi:hypothetical protein
MNGSAQVGLLSQLSPGAAIETVLFFVPVSNRAFIHQLSVCNRGSAATFRFSISKAGAATSVSDYLYYDLPISKNDTFASDIEVTLSVNDTIRVYASTGNLTFTLFGMMV